MISTKELRMYKVLGVKLGASKDEITSAYRRLVKEYHPDASHRHTAVQFNQVVEAYNTLKVRDDAKQCIDFPVRDKRTRPGHQKREDDIFNLGNLLLNGKQTGIRAFAARKLGNSGKKSAYGFLRRALNDPSPLVQKSVVEAIGSLRIQQCSGELALLFHDSGREIKSVILDAVQNIGTQGGFRNIILAGMQDSDLYIRTKALQLFSR